VSASSAVAELSRAGIRQRHASALGAQLCGTARALSREVAMDHLDVVLLVARTLDSCGVRYVVGGSLASSVNGEPRATLDADLMVELGEADVPCVIRGLGEAFYGDADAMIRAARRKSSANLVHMATATKIDLFVMGATPIEAEQMERRQCVSVGSPPADLFVYTAEDILLQKLRWFRLGGDVSERQWRDIAGVVAVQGERLDLPYLRRAAGVIEVTDLLERALRPLEA
jgi:hypothetical protein